MFPGEKDRRGTPIPDTLLPPEASPLWPVVVILADIARRISQRHTAEFVLSGAQEDAAGLSPVAREEAA